MLAKPGERLIHHYAPDPTLKTTFRLKLMDAIKHLGEPGHQHIFGFHFILNIPATDRIHFGGIMVKNLPLGGGVALFAPFNPLLVFCPVNFECHLMPIQLQDAQGSK
jgi:hypothetical protein